jgi:hypothetical protein
VEADETRDPAARGVGNRCPGASWVRSSGPDPEAGKPLRPASRAEGARRAGLEGSLEASLAGSPPGQRGKVTRSE